METYGWKCSVTKTRDDVSLLSYEVSHDEDNETNLNHCFSSRALTSLIFFLRRINPKNLFYKFSSPRPYVKFNVFSPLNSRIDTEIEDAYPSPKDIPDFCFPVVQADITECSIYAVVYRLRVSPTYTITSHGGTFNHPDFPGVTITVPKKAVPPKAKFPLQLKVGMVL